MRICMVSCDYLPRPGGLAAHVYGLSRGLTQLGHEVVVLTCSRHGYPPGVSTEDGVLVWRVKIPESIWTRGLILLKKRLIYRRSFRFARYRPSILGLPLRAFHAKNNLDVVHCHGYGSDLCVPKWIPDVPCVFTNHTSMFIKDVENGKGKEIWERLAHADFFIAPSEQLRDLLVEIGADSARTETIPNGVDCTIFSPAADAQRRSQLGFDIDHLIVLTARRLVPKNGVRYLVSAAARFLRAVPKARLLVAGDGPQREELERLTDGLGIADKTTFLGNLSRKEMPAITNVADVVVLPSLKEATSIAGLEAMACAKPLVGTSVGGIPEIIVPEKTGLLVPPRDADALARATMRLLRDDRLRAQMATAARARVETQFSWKAIARRTVRVYREVIARR